MLVRLTSDEPVTDLVVELPLGPFLAGVVAEDEPRRISSRRLSRSRSMVEQLMP